MKTIKDAIQASSIEQRRRILNNINIDKNSKNFIIRGEAGKADGGGNDKIEYFKFKEPHTRIEDSVFIQIIATVAFENGDNNKGIIPLSMFGGGFVYKSILGFCSVGFAINNNGEYMEIHSVAEFLSLVFPGENDVYNEAGIQPITREEYYNLIK